MKLLFYVLNKIEKLDDLLKEMADKKVCGATVLDSMGMARLLYDKHGENQVPFLGSLRSFLNPEREKSKVLFMVIEEAQIPDVISSIEKVVGDLSKEHNGILFTVPIDFVKGMCKFGK